MSDMRIGCGYDVHAFCVGDHIMMGGVRVPHYKGVVAHSDGDVLIHALCDALLGALALGDLGKHFPDTSSEYENIDFSKQNLIFSNLSYRMTRRIGVSKNSTSNTESVWGAYGVFGPAPIGILNPKVYKIEQIFDRKLDRTFFQVKFVYER